MTVREEPSVAPVLQARVNSVPVEALDTLSLGRTVRTLQALLDLEGDLAALACPVTDALYALVPSLDDDRALRRAVLALKRDVHNGRTPGCTAGQLDAILGRLGPDDAALLRRWLEGVRRRDELRRQAEEAFGEELTAAGQALVASLWDPGLLRGLSLASPDFVATLVRGKEEEARPGTRFARSCFSYLARAAVKTSPFSTLTRVGLAYFDRPSEPARDAGAGSVLAYLSRGFALAWLMACARDRRLARAFQYELNRSIRQGDGGSAVLVPDYLCRDGFFFRNDRFVSAGGYAHYIRRLMPLGRAPYDAYLAALGGPEAHGTFARLMAVGLIRPVAPWERMEEATLGRLAEAIGQVPDEVAQQVADLLRALQSVAERATTAGPAERVRLIHEFRSRSEAGYVSLLGQQAPHWHGEAGVLYEDARVEHAIPPLGEAVAADLKRLGAAMRPYIIRTHLYDYLVADFVARYGRGAVIDDVLDFLTRFCARPDFQQLLMRAMRADTEATAVPWHERTALPVGRGSAAPSATVFFQLAASSPEAVRRGEHLMVFNNLNPGLGGLFARFNPLFAEGPGLREQVHRWLAELYPGARVYDFPIFADWSSLQQRGLGGRPVLLWPAEWPALDDRDGLDLRSLRLSHDPATDTLTLLDPTGTPAALSYLGVVPHFLISGPLRLLFVLMDPWQNGFRFSAGISFFTRPRPVPEAVAFTPRETMGRLVLRRASWRMPVRAFPVPEPGEAPFRFLERAHRWRTLHGIPEEVFLNTEYARMDLTVKRRKPLWVRFDSYHALAAAAQTLADGDVTAVVLHEALPGREQHWVPGGDGRPRAAEFAALLRWPVQYGEPGPGLRKGEEDGAQRVAVLSDLPRAL